MFSLIVPRKGTRLHKNVTVTTGVTPVVAANGNRKSVSFQNNGGVDAYIGPVGVAISGAGAGYLLVAGSLFTDNASADAWYAITASGSTNVHVIDVV